MTLEQLLSKNLKALIEDELGDQLDGELDGESMRDEFFELGENGKAVLKKEIFVDPMNENGWSSRAVRFIDENGNKSKPIFWFIPPDENGWDGNVLLWSFERVSI